MAIHVRPSEPAAFDLSTLKPRVTFFHGTSALVPVMPLADGLREQSAWIAPSPAANGGGELPPAVQSHICKIRRCGNTLHGWKVILMQERCRYTNQRHLKQTVEEFASLIIEV